MKRIAAFFLAVLLLAGVCLAEGTGDPNLDGGGGDMGGGTGESYWNPGNDGVRVTVLQDGVPVYTMDIANKDYSRSVEICFDITCKLDYINGADLTPKFDGAYTNFIPPGPLPTIINKNGGSNIEAIRSYFTDREIVEFIAQMSDLDFDELTNGEYKLMLEPVSYFKYKGTMYAMTATEAALYDRTEGGDLKLRMGTLTHQNQPFSMFLQRTDLGILPWVGTTSEKQPNEYIISYLGVGIVSFRYTEEQEPEGPELPAEPEPGEPEPPEPEDPTNPITGNGTYRTDTDVITSVLVRSTYDVTPDDDAYITFTILGRTYRKQYVCPAGSSQLVWIRWHTPAEPQSIHIQVSGGGVSGAIPVTISALKENTPPNPVWDGPGINAGQYQPGFRLAEEPDWGRHSAATWREWYPTWHTSRTVGGHTYPGYWTFSILEYGASLAIDYDLAPSDRCPTAFARGTDYTMKSGYGVQANCKVKVTGIGGASPSDVVPVQSVLAVFPDWRFGTYNRLLEPESGSSYLTQWHFKANPYSYYAERVHFVPVWYPASETPTRYPVPLAVFDAWTPAGQLYATVSDYVTVAGGSMYDDWYIRVIERPPA
jgi:hypothetical protein